MSRRTFDENRSDDGPIDVPQQTHECPARGCPNAASVTLDGKRWACYWHAKADPHDWTATTQWVGESWPANANWNHPDKVAHEAAAAAKRRAALPQHPAASLGMSMADALSMATRAP